jgi:5-oxopent-3-ene-1,2,5-tricarboxylate decarboxylase / 2-hydroxyhepta-2,4-diene-1,7-dioate isomerase
MTVAGNIYGVVLNDRAELDRLAPQFAEKPYLAPPVAPVVYMKPLSSIVRDAVALGNGEVVCAPTLALLIALDATGRTAEDALDCVGAVALALDLSVPELSFYRPAIAAKNGDGFLALGEWQAPCFPAEIGTAVDGKQVHRWGLARLLRSPAVLLSALSQFMTLRAGDVLLVGLPGDAPHASAGQSLVIEANGLPDLHVRIAA